MSDNNYSNGEVKGNEGNYGGENYAGNQYAGESYGAGPAANYNGAPRRGVQGDPSMQRPNPRNINPMPYQPNSQYNYNPYPNNNFRGADGMYYQNNYKAEDDYYYQCPHPGYPQEHDCDYYDRDRGYYRTPGPGRRASYDPCHTYNGTPNSIWNPNMFTDFIHRPRVNDFLRGVGIATVGLILAPTVAKTLRPIIVKAVQGAMTASEDLKGIFADAKEDIEDIFAEAKWDGSAESEVTGE